jgi:hypothetical protein
MTAALRDAAGPGRKTPSASRAKLRNVMPSASTIERESWRFAGQDGDEVGFR